MHLHQRHRRSMYAFERESRLPRAIKPAAALAVMLFAVWWVGSSALGMLGFGDTVQREPVTLYTEGRGTVTVSLQGEEEQPAENGMNLFPGDTVTAGPAVKAAFLFFDGTWARMDAQGALAIDESGKGESTSRAELTLQKGRVWIGTPAKADAPAVTRLAHTPGFTLSLPHGSEVLLSVEGVSVYHAEGEGITVSMAGTEDFVIGEGQKWAVPDGTATDPYATRHALSAADLEEPFVLESRRFALQTAPASSGSGTVADAEPLTLTEPPSGFTLRAATLSVRGTAGEGVASVTVNGGEAILDTATRTWSQQVSPPEGAKTLDLQVKALDAEGKTLATIARSVTVEPVPSAVSPDAPTVTSPAATGQTFRTNAAEVVIRGTSPANAAAIYVNNYKLQLFSPEKGTWSYLASLSLGNMKAGSNVYEVTAMDAAGTRSPAAAITIIHGEGEGGISGTPSSAGVAAAASSAPALNPSLLPKNDPLTPGVLTVTAPTAGSSHTETGTGFLLEGKTSAQTETMWVNDYRLQLYQPGKTYWNYIASAAFGNLKKGQNVYVIIARNAKGEILDRFEYTVQY